MNCPACKRQLPDDASAAVWCWSFFSDAHAVACFVESIPQQTSHVQGRALLLRVAPYVARQIRKVFGSGAAPAVTDDAERENATHETMTEGVAEKLHQTSSSSGDRSTGLADRHAKRGTSSRLARRDGPMSSLP